MKFLKILFLVFFIMLTKSISLENKIILKIENDIITTIDILNEVNNLKFFIKEVNQINEDEIYKIAIESITKHKIKKNEILKNFKNINFKDEDYLNFVIKKKFENLGYKNLRDFKEELKMKKINYDEFKEKIKVDIIWNQIIFSKYNDKVIIKEDEIRKKIQSKKNYNKSFNLKEIVFQLDDNNEIQTRYNLIKEDINKLGFESAALKHSISNTSKDGGNLGWVSEGAINKELVNELNKLEIRSFTAPIRISSGFLILQKYDEKQEEENIDLDKEVKKLIDYERNQQLNNYSNLYYDRVKKNLNINAP